MKDVLDLAALCLPFTAGGAVGAALAGAGGAAAGTVLVAATGLLAVVSIKRTGILPYCILFFILGFFCCISAGMRPVAGCFCASAVSSDHVG